MSSRVISVEHLSKAYSIGLKEEIPDTLVGAAAQWLRAPAKNFRRLRRLNTFEKSVASKNCGSSLSHDDGQLPTGLDNEKGDPDDIMWALRDVSFEVSEGEVVGIIGRNGAGKSTLLKILSRITEPTNGRVVIRGRVSSLLEVGTGFHPELTGRENVYMNGTILGMRKREIDRKFDEIVDFSGIEKYLDTPVKRYSSGMSVRLAFAVAAHLEPEILIVDEVLAVGDSEFQTKCIGKMQSVAKSGRTVLFVSHNMHAVSTLTTRGLLLAGGILTLDAATQLALDAYGSNGTALSSDWTPSDASEEKAARIRRVRLLGMNNKPCPSFSGADDIVVEIECDVASSSDFQVAFRLNRNSDGLTVFTTSVADYDQRQTKLLASGLHVMRCVIPGQFLAPGSYHLLVAVNRHVGMSAVSSIDLAERTVNFEVRADNSLASYDGRCGIVTPKIRWTINSELN